MPERARHIIGGVGWVIASLLGWSIICQCVGFTFIYLVKHQVRFPAWTLDAYGWTALSGIVLVPCVVAVLAMRAKLPGTGGRRPQPRGFPVGTSKPSDKAIERDP
jgi:hypothetical protein